MIKNRVNTEFFYDKDNANIIYVYNYVITY